MDEKEKQERRHQLLAKVYTDDGEIDPSPDYALIIVTEADAWRILTRLQTAAALKAGMDSFFSYKTQSGVAEFIQSEVEFEELLDRDDEYVRVRAGEEFTDEQVEEARGELRMLGHLAEYSDEGVRFIAFDKHSGNQFWTPWIPAAEFEAVTGAPLSDKVVLFSLSYGGVDRGSLVGGYGHDPKASDAEMLLSEMQSHVEDLRDKGLVIGPALSFV